MRVTGTTEHLRQLVDDMNAVGIGATDSQTYRAIVDELALRENKNGRGAAATATPATEANPHQKVGISVTNVDLTDAVAQGVPESGDVFADMRETPDVDYVGDMIEVSWSGATVHFTRSGARTVALRILAQLTQEGADTEAPEPPGALRRWTGTAEAAAVLREDMQ